MIINGFALERKSDGADIAWWQTVPARIEIPEALLVVMGAPNDWENDEFRIVTRQKDIPGLPVPRPSVRKSTIIARLNEAGKLQAASAALNADLYTRERWYAPDRPTIYTDDAEALALLNAIGADPEFILAPE